MKLFYEKLKMTPAPVDATIIQMYQVIAQLKFVKVVCEVEITDAQRTIALVSAKPTLKVHLFNSRRRDPYVKMTKVMHEMFPAQVSINRVHPKVFNILI